MRDDLELGMCEVCNAEPAVGVACSVLGPVSVAYGLDCLTRGYDPLGIVLATMFCVGPRREDYAPGFAETIERSLTFHGLTWERAVAGIDWTDAP